jgi:predicted acylesterase/phospholipase RssA
MTEATRIEVGLVLQGGGALGAYQWGAITALLDLMDEAEKRCDAVVLKAVTGVSIGAVNAACVVGSRDRTDARERLARLWEHLRLDAFPLLPAAVRRDLSLFGLPGFYMPRADYWNLLNWTHFYDTSPLLRTLNEHVDFAQINRSETALVLTAVDVASGELIRFRNRSGAQRGNEPTTGPVKDEVVEMEAAHVLASCSLAPQFPWVHIGDARYWDGGLVDNTPLGDAIDAFSGEADAKRLLVVMNLYPLRARLPKTLAEVQDRVHELMYGSRLRQDRKSAERVNRLVATIDELAKLVPKQSLSEKLRHDIEQARLFKLVTVVDVDMQDPSNGQPAPQHPLDDAEGLRDFSAKTVERRRATGHTIATNRLTSHLGRTSS